MKPPCEMTVADAHAWQGWSDFGLYLEGLDYAIAPELTEEYKDDWFNDFLMFYAGYYTLWYEIDSKAQDHVNKTIRQDEELPEKS